MKSRSQPNHPGLTSPAKLTPQPTNWRSIKAPSLICRVGRTTAPKSMWPQGCGMYQAAVKSGDGDLNGRAALPKVQVDPAGAVPATVQVVNAVFCDNASPTESPALVQPSVSGASADTEKAPGMPQGANGCV